MRLRLKKALTEEGSAVVSVEDSEAEQLGEVYKMSYILHPQTGGKLFVQGPKWDPNLLVP